jgi:predicted MFS family arabinose efflux permease
MILAESVGGKMNQLKQHRLTFWVVSAILAVAALAMHLCLPDRFASYALWVLVVAYLLSWAGIFLHTDSATPPPADAPAAGAVSANSV